MRVTIAYDCLFPINRGGGERVYRRIAELLVQRGVQVTYVTRNQWQDGSPPEACFAIEGIWKGDIYDAAGGRTIASAVGFAEALLHYFRTHRNDADVVVVSALPPLNVVAVSLALLGTNTMIVSDWLEVWKWQKWRDYSGLAPGTLAYLLQLGGLWLGDLQTVNSRFTAARVQRYRPRASPLVLGLVDLAAPSKVESIARPAAPFILFVGRHIADKRLSELPDALRVARREVSDLRLVVVGAGPETDAVRERVVAAGLDDAVDFLGQVTDDKLQELFATASALVNPSQREGFGLVIAEAAAHGTPSVVVAGEDNAAADLIVEGVNGFVADAVHPSSLGPAIARAVTGGDRLRRSTADWFAAARIEQGLDASIDALLRVYHERQPKQA